MKTVTSNFNGEMAVPIAIGRSIVVKRTPKHNGEMAEWSIAAVLKTVEGYTSGGSNPSSSAFKCRVGSR